MAEAASEAPELNMRGIGVAATPVHTLVWDGLQSASGARAQEFRYSDTRFHGMSDQERLEAMRTAELPERSEPGWPALRLENRVYSSRVFRKLHMELGVRQDGLQVAASHAQCVICSKACQHHVFRKWICPASATASARAPIWCTVVRGGHACLVAPTACASACQPMQVLHCVMFPRREYELPIFGLDVVARGDKVPRPLRSAPCRTCAAACLAACVHASGTVAAACLAWPWAGNAGHCGPEPRYARPHAADLPHADRAVRGPSLLPASQRQTTCEKCLQIAVPGVFGRQSPPALHLWCDVLSRAHMSTSRAHGGALHWEEPVDSPLLNAGALCS